MKNDSLGSQILLCLLWQCTGSWSLYSGSWCPYQVEKVVPCRVRNGTEPYLGPNLCWKSLNGSFSCTKKILHRPKYITIHKKIKETKYKCCPGLEGSDCQDECFNCTMFHHMADRIGKIETRLDFMDNDNESQKDRENELLRTRTFLEDEIFYENRLHDKDGERRDNPIFAALDTRISHLLNEFRDMETRIQILESEVYRLSTVERDQMIHPHHSSREIMMEPTPLRQPPLTTTVKSLTTTTTDFHKSVQHKSTIIAALRLEDNLDRGDIASTLNDDYGEELFENSTEQYTDPLHKDF